MANEERYSRLAPLGLEKKYSIVKFAIAFFSPLRNDIMCKLIGQSKESGIVYPLSALDFLKFLEISNALTEPYRYQFRISQLLKEMSSYGILDNYSIGFGLNSQYISLREVTKLEERNDLWLAPILGPSFLYQSLQPSIIHLTGKTVDGDIRGGTGILVDNSHIITCAHVVSDMMLDNVQIVHQYRRNVVEVKVHPTRDVAAICFQPMVEDYFKLSFADPDLLEEVYTLGYPRVPQATEAPLLMHKGEIVHTGLKSMNGEMYFLYSAIARPGNSGGPIVSTAGRILGIVTSEFSLAEMNTSTPFYAGIHSTVIDDSMRELDTNIHLSLEKYE